MDLLRAPARLALPLSFLVILGGCVGKRRPGQEQCEGDVVTASEVEDRYADRIDGTGRVQVEYDEQTPMKGSCTPLVTIVEYSDFQCPFCARLANSLDPVVARYPDVRLVFKQFPLPMHSGAEPAARASLAAHEQGKFWAMHDRLFRAGQAMSEDDLLGYAADVGLDLERFKADFESDEIRDRVGAQMKSGQAVGVNSTPSLFINGSPQRGALPPDALGELIETELAQAKKLVDEGIPRRELYAHMMKAAGR